MRKKKGRQRKGRIYKLVQGKLCSQPPSTSAVFTVLPPSLESPPKKCNFAFSDLTNSEWKYSCKTGNQYIIAQCGFCNVINFVCVLAVTQDLASKDDDVLSTLYIFFSTFCNE